MGKRLMRGSLSVFPIAPMDMSATGLVTGQGPLSLPLTIAQSNNSAIIANKMNQNQNQNQNVRIGGLNASDEQKNQNVRIGGLNAADEQKIQNVRMGGLNAADLSLRAQKKLLSRMATRGVVRHLISPGATRLFDNLYDFLKLFYSKKKAEKVIKNMIKLCVKIGLTARTGDPLPQLVHLQRHLRTVTLTFISFSRLAYSYDRGYLQELLNETHNILRALLIEAHLSDKSQGRADFVFEHLNNEQMLDQLFTPNGTHAENLLTIADDLERLIDENDL